MTGVNNKINDLKLLSRDRKVMKIKYTARTFLLNEKAIYLTLDPILIPLIPLDLNYSETRHCF